MSTQTKGVTVPQQNGVATTPKKENLTAKAVNPTKEVKPISKEVEKAIEALKPSAEDRIRNAENFAILTKKFAHLKGKNEELKKFQISSDGSKESVLLKNAAGFEMKVTNSNVMEKVVNLLQNELNTLLTATEKEVQEFVI